MFPKVYRTIRTPAVIALVGDRVSGHGKAPQTDPRPYITWQIVTGDPYSNLSSAAGGDFTTVQIDCYHKDEAGAQALALAVRGALDAELIVNRVAIDTIDSDTALYRVGLEADFIDQR
jgi:hypothetical protein